MDQLKEFIAAVLLEAQQNGRGLPVTFLVKFLYLLDVYYAEATEGNPITGVDWFFYHFGPYSEQVQSALDDCVKSGFILKEEVEDRGFELLQLNPSAKVSSLDEMDLPFHAKNRLKLAINKFRYDLPGLLNYVYFRTEPMEKAVPHENLSFGECRKIRIEDIKPIPLKSPSHKKEQRIKKLFSEMKEDYIKETTPVKLSTPPIYDDIYFDSFRNELDEIEIDETVYAEVSFNKNA